jgi:hypothetical protein
MGMGSPECEMAGISGETTLRHRGGFENACAGEDPGVPPV